MFYVPQYTKQANLEQLADYGIPLGILGTMGLIKAINYAHDKKIKDENKMLSALVSALSVPAAGYWAYTHPIEDHPYLTWGLAAATPFSMYRATKGLLDAARLD